MSEEGTEMKISTSSVPPDDLQKEHISSQFKRKHVTIQGYDITMATSLNSKHIKDVFNFFSRRQNVNVNLT